MTLVVKNPTDKTVDTRDMGLIPESDRSQEEEVAAPVFFPGKFHEQRGLAGWSPQGHRVRQNTHTHIYYKVEL